MLTSVQSKATNKLVNSQDGFKQIEKEMTLLTQKYEESYKKEIWEGAAPVDLWAKRPKGKKVTERKVKKADRVQETSGLSLPDGIVMENLLYKPRRQPARKTQASAAPVRGGSRVVAAAASAANTTTRSPSASPAPSSGSRKRKINPVVEYIHFDVDSDNDESDDERFKEMEKKDIADKARRQSAEYNDQTFRKMTSIERPRSASYNLAAEAEVVSEEEKNNAEMMAEKAKEEMSKDLDRELFGDDDLEEGEMDGSEGKGEGTPADSGYASAPSI